MILAAVGALTCILLSHNSEVFDTPIQLGGYTCNALFFGGVVALASQCRPGALAYRILACWPLRMLGKYSYGIYVWHLFVAVAVYKVTQRFSIQSPWGSVVASTAGSLLVAVLSYHLYEAWFLKLKKKF
jgi:peptidoglycan/LPS O-acetylase OafA/YrhL